MLQESEDLDFQEILPIFYPEQAEKEAERCLYCYDAPCKQGCPASIDIPHFIQSIRSKNYKRAARLINKENPFGAVCGRVCPTERQCEENCSAQFVTGMPIEIGRLQAFAVEYGDYIPPKAEKTKNCKVAVIGSGPAGLACARELVRNEYEVTVFESKKKAGGMVAYGVPEYRCSHDVTAAEVELIAKEGVEIRTGTPFNQDVSILFDQGYQAVFVGVGLTKTSRPEVPGLDLSGVYMGLDFLNRIGAGETPEVGKKVVVVGGGDTALDCARSALRLGAEQVTLMYRRSFTELPAEKREIEEALDEGIIFRTLTLPINLVGDDKKVLRAVECVTMKLGPADASGRRSPEVIKDSNHRLACNTLIFATGFEPSKLLQKLLPKAEFVKGKFPKVHPETYETSMRGVFCAGDVVNGGATVVQAVKEGKIAARGIMKMLEAKEARKAGKDHAAAKVDDVAELIKVAETFVEETVASTPIDSVVEPVEVEEPAAVEQAIAAVEEKQEDTAEMAEPPKAAKKAAPAEAPAKPKAKVKKAKAVEEPVVEEPAPETQEDDEIARQREELKKKLKEKAQAKKAAKEKVKKGTGAKKKKDTEE